MPVDVKELLKALELQRQQRITPPSIKTSLPVGLIPPTLPGSNPDINMAKTLLANANVNWQNIAGLKDKALDRDSSGPSVISRIFDILSRGNYAVANAVKAAQDKTTDNGIGDILREGWEGLAGYDKTTFSDVNQQTINQSNPDWLAAAKNAKATNTSMPLDLQGDDFQKYFGGFISDVALDPINAVGGLVSKFKGRNIDDELTKLATGEINVSLPPPVASKSLADISSKFSGLGLLPDVDPSTIKYSNSARSSLENIDFDLFKDIKNNFIRDRTQSHWGKDNSLNPWEAGDLARGDFERSKFSQGFPDLKIPITSPKPELNTSDFDFSNAQDIIEAIANKDFTALTNETKKIANNSNLLSELGIATRTEINTAQQLAEKYRVQILNKPNKFSKGGKEPWKFNPAQQANFAIRTFNKSRQTKDNLDAFRMLRAGEDALIAAGHSPTYWDGSTVRLTDVILELANTPDEISSIMKKEHLTQLMRAFIEKDPSKISDINVRQAIENLRSRNSVSDAPAVNAVLSDALEKKDVLSEILSGGQLNQFQKIIERESKVTLSAQNVAPGSILTTQKILKDIHARAIKATPPLAATEIKKNYIQSYIEGATKEWTKAQQAQTKGIEDITGVSAKTLSTRIGQSNRAVDWFLSRVATWYGQKDLRPEVLIRTMTANNSAAARARMWNEFSKKYSPETIEDAFRVAQGIKTSATPEIQEAAAFFSKSIENMFTSTGITAEADKAASVAKRSGMLMKDINEQLTYVNSPFKFTNAVVTELGKTYDYSKGSDWLKSWELAKISDPVDFMFRISTAVEQLMGKYAFYDEMAARWGNAEKTSTHTTKIKGSYKERKPSTGLYGMRDDMAKAKKDGSPRKPKQPLERHHRLNGLYFPSDVASQIERVITTWDQIYNPKSNLVRHLDKVTRAWKSGVTIYAPSHHIRNLIGDAYLSWIAGVNDFGVYNKAAKVLYSEKGRYNDLETVENLVGRNAIANAMTRPGDVITRTKSGVDLTAEQIYVAAHNTGLLVHANVIEELFGDPLIKWKPFKGKVQESVHKLAENREHYMRLAHFIDYIQKSKEKNIQTLFKDASKEVRKWHPDGTDLTDFERNVMRRIIPFYSWTRKAIPLLVEGSLLSPGKVTAYPKGMEAIQGMFGIEPPNRQDPFPEDQLFPDWMREKGIGPIAEHGMDGLPGLIASFSRSIPGFTGDPSGYAIVNPSNPLIDMVAQYGGMGNLDDPLKGIAQSITPLARIPSEILHGETFNDAPLEPGKYIAENIPIAAMLSRISNIGAFGPTSRGEEEGLFNSEALINLITALGLQGTGPYIKTAEFQERDRRRDNK